MIKDSLQHIDYYNYLIKELQLGLKYLKGTDFSTVENGKYEVFEDKVYAIVQDYTSKPLEEGKFEAHKKYIDIQYIIEGQEQIGYSDIDNFDEDTEYNEEKDIVFLAPKSDLAVEKAPMFIKLKAQEFAIFTVNDAHMPSISVENPSFVRKVVVKVSI